MIYSPFALAVLILAASWGIPILLIGGEEYSDGIAAIVNKEVITFSELEDELHDEKIRLRAKFGGKELTLRMIQKEYGVLNQLIEQKLQLQAAKEKGLEVTKEEIEKAKARLPSVAQLNNLSGGDVEQRVREQILLQKLLNFEVYRNVMITESDIQQYYENHPDQFLTPGQYRLRQILFLNNPQTIPVEQKFRAEGVYQKLRAGGDFTELAAKHSDGPEANQGGHLGLINHDELLDPIAQALQSMAPGDISKPIQTTLGWHIIMLDETPSPQPRPFEEVKDEIERRLRIQLAEEAFLQWLAKLKKKAFIEVKFFPKSGPSSP